MPEAIGDIQNEKELVLKFILDSVKKQVPLNNVSQTIERRYDNDLSAKERTFIERTYIENVFQEFLHESLFHLKKHIKDVRSNLNSFLDDFKKGNEIPKYFYEIKYFEMLSCHWSKLSTQERKRFCKTLKSECFQLLDGEIRSLNAEIDLVNETKRTLRNIFIHSLVNKDEMQECLKLLEAFRGDDLNSKLHSFIDHLKKTSARGFEALREKVLSMSGGDITFIFAPKELDRMFNQFRTRYKRKESKDNNGIVLEIEGYFMKLSDIQNEMATTGVYEIRIIGKEIICIDKDLRLPGINLVIVSPEVLVFNDHVLDTSGVDGVKHECTKARSGQKKGEDGDAGEIGSSGQAGGNVFVYTTEFVNDDQLTIIANGGMGQNGQDGGNGEDGIDGKDGYEMSKSEFDEKYPPTTKVGEFFALRYEFGFHRDERTDKGGRVIWSAFIAVFGYPLWQGYCIHYGGEGTRGGRGGMGGQGGQAGTGGSCGTIEITCEGHKVNVEARKGRDGENGKDGVGGKGGYNGRRGLDIGRVEPSQYRKERSYGPARLSLDFMSEDSSDYAYCANESRRCGSNKYARIRELSRERRERCEGQRSQKSEKRRNAVRNVRQDYRAVPISKESINQSYQCVVDSTVKVMEIYHGETKMELTCEGIEQYKNLKSSSVCFKQSKAIEIKNIKKVMDSYQRLPAMPLVSCISDISENLTAVINDTQSSSHRSVTCAIKAIINAISDRPVDDPKQLAVIHKECLNHSQQLLKKCDHNFDRTDVIEQLKKLGDILIYKYKFACFEALAKEIKKIEEIHCKRNRKTCQVKVMFMVKMRLTHSCCDIVKDIMPFSSIDDISRFSSRILQSLYSEITGICKTINDMEDLRYNVNIDNDLSEDEDDEVGMDVDEDDREKDWTSRIEGELLIEGNNGVIDNKEDRDDESCSQNVTNSDWKESNEEIHRISLEQETVETEHPGGHMTQDNPNSKIIENYCIELEETQKDERYFKTVEIFKTLAYIDSWLTTLLLDVMTKKILVDGFHLPFNVFLWFTSRIFEQTEEQSLKRFVWIVSSNEMVNWLTEYVVGQLVYQCKLPLSNEDALRKHLRSIHDRQWIPVIWELVLGVDDLNFKDDDDDNNNKLNQVLLALISIQEEPCDEDIVEQLTGREISQWPEIVKDYNCLKFLVELPLNWSEQALIEADAYVDELRKIYGDDIVDFFLKILSKSENLSEGTICQFLSNFYYEIWPFTVKTLKMVENENVQNWPSKFSEICSSGTERSLDELFELMKDDGSSSTGSISSRSDSCARDAQVKRVLEQSILDEEGVVRAFGYEFVVHWKTAFDSKIKQMGKDKKEYYKSIIKVWAQEFKSNVESLSEDEKEKVLFQNLSEVLSFVEVGLSLLTGFKLRHTQRLAVALLVKSNPNGLLEQVSTGEGKTIIIVAFCVIKNLIGHSVDVITSSPVLAERDATENKEYFELFGVSVSHNCSEDIQRRAEAYKKDIVYGEIGSFERDILLQQFYNKDTFGKRGFDTIVVDEVDSMLLDKAENVLYLSHDISDFDALEPLFVYIWSFVHDKDLAGTDEDVELVRAALMNAMYGTICKDDLEKRLNFIPRIETISDVILQELCDKNILDRKGRIRCLSKLKDTKIVLDLNKKLDLDETIDTDGAVLNFLKDAARQGTEIDVPNYLEQFIELHLTEWIKNAFMARFMNERQHYIVDIDRSDVEFGDTANIVIIDVDTGVEQSNMQWSNGLHQFLQLKHGCRLSVENLKAVFMSNLAFFRLYEKSIYGLTGTLGSEKERNSLKELYGVDYVNIPTFRPKRFFHHSGNLFNCEDAWIKKSVEIAAETAKVRPVLMICNTIHELEKFHREFLRISKKSSFDLHVYKSSYEEPNIVSQGKTIDKGCVILATNLAGRGTDLKISDEMDKAGGLHVILTYLPRNTRIEEQAFGRAARKGQNGSGQLCIMSSDNLDKKQSSRLSILKMAKQRNAEEKQRLVSMKNHYESFIMKEEDYFNRFKSLYAKFQTALENLEVTEKEVILNACLDRWALWLDSVGQIMGNDDADVESRWIRFERQMKEECQSKSTSSVIRFRTKSPCLRVKLAVVYIKQKEYLKAMKILQEVITDEPKFSESAHYYYAHCIIKANVYKGSDSTVMLTYHLLNAERGFKHRIEVLSKLNNMRNLVKKFYGKDIEHFISNDSYEQQKTDLITVFNIFCDSVRNVLGQIVQFNALDSIVHNAILTTKIIDNRKLFQGFRFYDLAVKADKQKTKMREFMEEQEVQLLERYELYSSEIKERIDLLRRWNRDLKAEDFQGLLPSREQFWQELSQSNLLCSAEEYIVVDKKKADSIFLDKNYYEKNIRKLKKLARKDFLQIFQIDKIRSINEATREENTPGGEDKKGYTDYTEHRKKHTSEFEKSNASKNTSGQKCSTDGENNAKYVNPSGTKGILHKKVLSGDEYPFQDCSKFIPICMFPEHIEYIISGDYLAIPSSSVLDREFLKILECSGALYTNKTAYFNKRDAKRCKLGKYDGISEKNFCEIEGVNERIAKEIFEELQLSGVWEADLPKMQKIDLPKHKRFESEVKSILDKYHAYRVFLLQLINANGIDDLPFHQLNPNPHQTIWEDLIELNIVCPVLVENITDKDAKKILEDENSRIRVHRDDLDSVATAISNWKAGLFKFETVDSSLKDMREMLGAEIKRGASIEIQLFESKGFDHVIVLEEKKWSLWTILRIVAIVAIGIAQIALGIVVEVFTVGAGTFLAAGLIEEGISDIMFAIECAFTGYCTFKDYLINKAISLVFTVVSGGVGAFFSRGAKYSRYGFKIGGEHLMEKAGMALVKNTGKKRVIKECVKTAGKKLLKAGALGLATSGLNMAVEKLIRDRLSDMCKSICYTLKQEGKHQENRRLIKEICQNVGNQKGKEITIRVGNDLWRSKENKIRDYTMKAFKAICGGFQQALAKSSKKQGTNQEITALLSVVSSALTVASHCSAVNEMRDMCISFSEELPHLLEAELKRVKEGKTRIESEQDKEITEKEDIDRDVTCILDELMNYLGHQVEAVLENKLLKPLLHHCANKLVMATGELMKKMKANFDTYRHEQKLKKILQKKSETTSHESCIEATQTLANNNVSDYQRSLVKLLKKVRDPDLYAKIIRHDIPMGVHEAQAICNVINKPIHIKYVGDETQILPLKFYPKGSSGGEPLIIYFKSQGKGGVGHFSDSLDSANNNSSEKNSCLMDAVSKISGTNVDRNQVANIVKNDEKIRDGIIRGIHTHFIERGGTGGFVRPKKEQERLTRLIDGIKNQKGKATKEQKRQLKDLQGKAGTINGIVYNTGNHELLPRGSIDQWKELGLLDEHLHLRVDTRYAVYFVDIDKVPEKKKEKYGSKYDGKLQGHPTSVFSDPKNRKKSQKTGAHKYMLHDPNLDAIMRYETKEQKQCLIIGDYLKTIKITKKQLEMIKDHKEGAQILKETYTATGHDLSKPYQLNSFLNGLSREIYKGEVIMQRIQGSNSFRSPGNDYYCQDILQRVKEANNLEGFGRLLMEPAPYGQLFNGQKN